MNKRLMIIISFLLTFMMILVSCSSISTDLMDGIKSNNEERVFENMNQSLNQSILNFTWKMFEESSKNNGNIMISTPSIYLALTMALNGADDKTKEDMLSALSVKDISLEELNVGVKEWTDYLMSDDRTGKLSIANSIWYRDGFEADEEFLQTKNRS